MPSSLPLTDMSFMIRSLRFRMENQHKTTLVLGTRAGALMRSSSLPAMLEPFSSLDLSNLKASARFSQLYRILTHPDNFSHAEIEALLIRGLSTVNTTDADRSLARLVQLGLFDTIVTANIDDMLRQALSQVGMRELRDFTIFNMVSEAHSSKTYTMDFDRKSGTHIISVFGELTSRNYIVSDRCRYLNDHRSLTNWLQATLRHDCLVIGLDPRWDEELYRLFPDEGNALWFVNEDDLDKTSPLYSACKARGARYVTGMQGRYDRFVTALYSALVEEEGIPDEAPIPTLITDTPGAANVTAQEAIDVFLSYAPEDEALLHRLLAHMAVLQREKKIRTWYSGNIIPGQQREQEIERHLQSARLILLLVSAHFLTSDYVYTVEIQRALERQRRGEAHVIPIILRPVDWRNTPFGGLSSLPTNGKPVMSWHDVESAFAAVVSEIRTVLVHLSSTPSA